MKIGCVVLAAGNARRFGSNKLQVQVDGESLIRRALETVPSGLVTVVVSQYPEILSLAGEYGFEAVWNDQPDLGLSRSVRLGLERLTDCGGVLFLVADQPWLKRDSAEALAALWAQHPAKIVAMAHGGVRCCVTWNVSPIGISASTPARTAPVPSPATPLASNRWLWPVSWASPR